MMQPLFFDMCTNNEQKLAVNISKCLELQGCLVASISLPTGGAELQTSVIGTYALAVCFIPG